MTIDLFSRRNWRGQLRWFFTIRASNGEPVAQSEGYHNRVDAYETARMIRADAFDAEIRNLG